MGSFATALTLGVLYGTLGSVALTLLMLVLLASGIYLSSPYYSYVRWFLKTFANLRLRRLA